jgi:hypothetical protein
VGDNDNLFSPSDIAQVQDLPNVKLSVVPDADHSLETKDISSSIDILKHVATLCVNFCKESR